MYDSKPVSARSYVPLAENNVQDLISIVETNTLGTMLCCREVRQCVVMLRRSCKTMGQCAAAHMWCGAAGNPHHARAADRRAHLPDGRCESVS